MARWVMEASWPMRDPTKLLGAAGCHRLTARSKPPLAIRLKVRLATKAETPCQAGSGGQNDARNLESDCQSIKQLPLSSSLLGVSKEIGCPDPECSTLILAALDRVKPVQLLLSPGMCLYHAMLPSRTVSQAGRWMLCCPCPVSWSKICWARQEQPEQPSRCSRRDMILCLALSKGGDGGAQCLADQPDCPRGNGTIVRLRPQPAHLSMQVDGCNDAIGDGIADSQRGVQAAAHDPHIWQVADLAYRQVVCEA